ncbi:flavin reductase [Ruminococcus sp. M6(2020)]|uniref:Flavin reductase n=2 Tax=Ruminococcus difficilis TaxID=2763069 RepID=A0A934WSR3_9FIRM|nr:flavin reductase [Ruminococcus difficilis]MBK6089258.1 flavin reductase [Ruminococcus difficilis]
MFITNDIKYIGVNDHDIDLFEGQYIVPNGMAYNSYAIIDEKVAVMDTVDQHFGKQWLDNLKSVIGDRKPDYLVVQHMEPDHSANIDNFLKAYPEAIVVSSQKAFNMMVNFFGTDYADRRIVVKEGDTLELGKHTLNFVGAPMVHWPEVLMTYDSTDKVLFSADGFGKFGALDVEEDWACEARRYYIGIVGKYGKQVQNVLKKAAGLEIGIICPLHGPVLSENLGYYLDLYNTWSSYGVETDGIMIAYTSVYGHTKKAVELLADKLREAGCPKVAVNDLAREDMAECVEDAFRYGKIILATTTYNADIFPFMREFINHLTERNFQNKTMGFIENGSWAPLAEKTMRKMLEGCKNITYTDNNVHILSAMNDENIAEIDALCEELTMDYVAMDGEKADKNDLTALFNIGYGLYVVTARDGDKDNGCIVNTVSQVTNTPNRIAVCINKKNLTHDMVAKTGTMNVNCLSTDAPFSVFEHFGFQSGRDVDKIIGEGILRSDNGVAFLGHYINSFMSLKVEQTVDLDTHSMFICSVTEARVITDVETMTYTYYQNNVKPKPETDGKKGWVCKVCGYVYEGEDIPDDFICPLCKHGVADFEPIE